jgi:hypothetical protein
MRLVVTTGAAVFGPASDTAVTTRSALQALDGMAFDTTSLMEDALNDDPPCVQDAGIRNARVLLAFDQKRGELRTVATFDLDRRLTADELVAFKAALLDQYVDGVFSNGEAVVIAGTDYVINLGPNVMEVLGSTGSADTHYEP